MRFSTRRRVSGLTFVEIIVALGILGFGMMALMGLFSSQITSIKDISDYSIVVNLAEAQMQKYVSLIRNLQASDTLSLADEDVTAEVVARWPEQAKKLGKELKVVSTVAKYGSVPDRAFEIRIDSTWGSEKSHQLWTVVAVRDEVQLGSGTLE